MICRVSPLLIRLAPNLDLDQRRNDTAFTKHSRPPKNRFTRCAQSKGGVLHGRSLFLSMQNQFALMRTIARATGKMYAFHLDCSMTEMMGIQQRFRLGKELITISSFIHNDVAAD